MFIQKYPWAKNVKPAIGWKPNDNELGIVGDWLINEDGGATLYDSSGEGNNLAAVASCAIATGPSVGGKGISCDGSTKWFSGTTAKGYPNPATGPITFWVMVTVTTLGGKNSPISISDGNVNNLCIDIESGVWNVTGFGNLSAPALAGTTTVVAGVTYQVCYTWDGVTGRLYVNGNQEGSNTTAPQSFTPTNTFLGAFNASFDQLTGFVHGGIIAAQCWQQSTVYRFATNPFWRVNTPSRRRSRAAMTSVLGNQSGWEPVFPINSDSIRWVAG